MRISSFSVVSSSATEFFHTNFFASHSFDYIRTSNKHLRSFIHHNHKVSYCR